MEKFCRNPNDKFLRLRIFRGHVSESNIQFYFSHESIHLSFLDDTVASDKMLRTDVMHSFCVSPQLDCTTYATNLRSRVPLYAFDYRQIKKKCSVCNINVDYVHDNCGERQC